MIGIKMKPNIPVHYQKGEHITEGCTPPTPNNSVTRKDYTPPIIFTNLASIFAYMTIIVRSMYNFVNCLQFNIRYDKVERPAPMSSALVKKYIEEL